MIESFGSPGSEDIFNGQNTKVARRTCPQTLWKIAARKLDQLDSAITLEGLRMPPGNRLEALEGDRAGQYSLRINEQYLVQQQRSLTPSLALRFAKYFGTSADFWMNLQLRWDFYHACKAEAAILSNIQPRSA